jgi:hypothetical protein
MLAFAAKRTVEEFAVVFIAFFIAHEKILKLNLNRHLS